MDSFVHNHQIQRAKAFWKKNKNFDFCLNVAICTRECFIDWGSINPFSSGDNFFIFVCTKGNLLFLINTFGTFLLSSQK